MFPFLFYHLIQIITNNIYFRYTLHTTNKKIFQKLLIQKIFPGLQIYKWRQTYHACESKDFVQRKMFLWQAGNGDAYYFLRKTVMFCVLHFIYCLKRKLTMVIRAISIDKHFVEINVICQIVYI